MKLLVLTTDYPRPDGSHQRMFVHVRDLYYKAQGLNVTVLNFTCPYDYEIDGIRVISLSTFRHSHERYHIALSHASNLRNHYLFLKRHAADFPVIVFFFHGHEILYLNRDYPKPYPYLKRQSIRGTALQDAYDHLKICLWRNYYRQLAPKSQFVFVSQWIKNRFTQNTGLTDSDLLGHCCIIHNSIGASFESESYDWSGEKTYDFITIRSDLDGSKYGVDLVVQLAERNADQRFLLIGQGDFFVHNPKPVNVEWINTTLDHRAMLHHIDQAKCGLLLTRQDTQGVMTCELAAYGIPTITSDLPVCHEFFDELPNVVMIPNDHPDADIVGISQVMRQNGPYPKDTCYFSQNTIAKEVELFHQLWACHLSTHHERSDFAECPI